MQYFKCFYRMFLSKMFLLLLFALIACAVAVTEQDCYNKERDCWNSTIAGCDSEAVVVSKATTVDGAKCDHPTTKVCKIYGGPRNDVKVPYCHHADGSWDYCYRDCDNPPNPVNCFDHVRQCWSDGPGCNLDVYQGNKSTTVGGYTCQSWSAQSPYFHGDKETQNGNINQCRNPDNEKAPWCYTTDPNQRWDYCFPTCKPMPKWGKGCRIDFYQD